MKPVLHLAHLQRLQRHLGEVGNGTSTLDAVLHVELFRGIGHDVYMLVQGYEATGLVVWIVIHTALIVTGLLFLRSARSASAPNGV